MDPNRLKYLEMIQSVITRMASNQVTLRTWSVSLGTAAIGFAAAKEGNPRAALIAILPAVTFWILDGYYLALERKFRDLYNVEAAKTVPADFAMRITPLRSVDWLGGCRRAAVWMIHVPVIVVALLVSTSSWTK